MSDNIKAFVESLLPDLAEREALEDRIKELKDVDGRLKYMNERLEQKLKERVEAQRPGLIAEAEAVHERAKDIADQLREVEAEAFQHVVAENPAAVEAVGKLSAEREQILEEVKYSGVQIGDEHLEPLRCAMTGVLLLEADADPESGVGVVFDPQAQAAYLRPAIFSREYVEDDQAAAAE